MNSEINGVFPGDGRCVACHTPIGLGMLMCSRDWMRVPWPTRREVSSVLRSYERGGATLDLLRAAQTKAFESVTT